MPAMRKQNQLAIKKKTESWEQCSAGIGWGRKAGDSHRIVLQRSYNDFSRGLRRFRISRDDAKAAYTCRKCGQWQGCGMCLEDIASLVCPQCRDWANDISERVHGRMVKDHEMRLEAMKLIAMVYRGQINMEEYRKLWDDMRAVQARSEVKAGK